MRFAFVSGVTFVALVVLAASRLCGADSVVVYPTENWETAAPAEVGFDPQRLAETRDYALTGGGSGMITRGGRVVLTWGDQRQRYDLKSTTKSIGVTALGVALLDGKVQLTDKANKHQPEIGVKPAENQRAGWLDKITLEHLATQTAGFQKPGGYTRLLFEPGAKWDYSDSGPNWLAECLTLAYHRDLRDLLFERVFTPIGIGEKDLTWRNNQYRAHTIDGVARREFGSGVSANVDAMARLGYLYLRGGKWRDKQLLPAEFVARCGTTTPAVVGLPEHGDTYDNASDHYGLLWWNNADGSLPDVPRDAFWSWGLYDSLIVVIPSLDIVAARAGKSWQREKNADHYAVLAPFLTPIAQAAHQDEQSKGACGDDEVPPVGDASRVVGIDFAPTDKILRLARGSDNWPLTWADDDLLYTAYGDGRGFEPFVEKKLSLGLATVSGLPDKPAGKNLRSESAEDVGNDRRGRKASGMLMVDGVLYMLVRNADNARLGWSRDHGQTWTWADWRFTTSFGCPTFLNFGRDYAGARDEFVYVYSFDSDSAYQPADRMVLARAPRDQFTDLKAYDYFERLENGEPRWTRDVDKRGAVLSRPGKCYRGGVTYNASLKTYLWAVLPGGDTRSAGGLAIYTADEPWGPWREIFATEEWDVGPGESASFPSKWISADGRTVHLVFSGDDSFSVRSATLHLSGE